MAFHVQATVIDWGINMSIRTLFRIYLSVTVLTLTLFLTLGLSGVFQEVIQGDDHPPLKKMANSLSVEWFITTLSSELPMIFRERSQLSFGQVATFVFEWMTHLNPFEPKSLLAAGVPGMVRQEPVLLYPNTTVATNDPPFDPLPPKQAVVTKPQVAPNQPQQDKPSGETQHNGQVQKKQKQVLIYHSHNRESWIPELKHKTISNPNLAFDEKINITLLGARLAKLLEKKGVGATSADTDYPNSVPTFKYTRSYSYSLKTVREAIARNGEFDFYFDLHRDSQSRNKTTIVREGKAYAQVYFIVGGKNPGWRKNYEFAKQIHDKVEERFPGLSKSIYAKSSNGNGEYNQSVSPNSALIEIGGPYNTLAESYRTIDLLAEVIAELYYDAIEVRGGE